MTFGMAHPADRLSTDMDTSRSPNEVRGRIAAWRLFQLVTVAALGYAGWRLLGHTPYRIDIDVYRMGGRAWLDHRPLYSKDAMFPTPSGLKLPFTYPPLAAVAFAPFAWLPLPAASAAITLTTLVLLVVSIVIVLTRLRVWEVSALPGTGWWRRCWLATAIVAPAAIWLEPIWSNFDFGQINVVLMALVIADAVPRHTPWPRGILVGLAIALKLTPAVFLLYFVLRRDARAALTALASFAAATAAGFLLAWRDSREYWTTTIRHTDRIGEATLNTNQNIAGVLARLDLDPQQCMLLWAVVSVAVLTLTVWAARRALRAGEHTLALICIALFGLVVSPVSWSHHWVWMLPAVLVGAELAYRRRSAPLGVLAVAGVALMVWTPIKLLPEHQEADAAGWRQALGASYLWWALLMIAAAGFGCAAARTAGTGAAQPATADVG